MITTFWNKSGEAKTCTSLRAADRMKIPMVHVALLMFSIAKESIMNSISGEMICRTIGPHGGRCCRIILKRDFKIDVRLVDLRHVDLRFSHLKFLMRFSAAVDSPGI